jgi:predicted GIY-YIG superfamily endonuclease
VYYVYLIRSRSCLKKTYIGFTTDIKQRLSDHNSGKSIYTAQYKPWKIIACVAFDSEKKARRFEVYLKRHGGREFARRHFW